MPFYLGDPTCRWDHAFDGDLIPLNLLMSTDQSSSVLDWPHWNYMVHVRRVEIAKWDGPMAEDPKLGSGQKLSPRRVIYHLWKHHFAKGVLLCIGGIESKPSLVHDGVSTNELYVRNLATDLGAFVRSMPYLQSFW
jgi:hypothetical protein